MTQHVHEVRDAVHVFIAFDDDERAVIDSGPFQRLRDIHQLALSYLVYPGASHKRFEHSLGVMELASRIYDVVTRPDKITDEVRDVVPAVGQRDHDYWRSVVRMAALCHDLGHLPFSHAPEDDLLPEGWDHERITREIIHSNEMIDVLGSFRPKIDPDDVVKLALGPKKVEKLRLGLDFTPLDGILAEMIVGDAFGADRMDYLLRDSLHTGAVYGRFDHHRLIDTLRIIPSAPREEGEEGGAGDPQLGCERGGLYSAEALVLARYFMFAQVYFHPTRLAYNEHLKDFLKAWLEHDTFPTDCDGHLSFSDSRVLVAIDDATADSAHPGHAHARRIVKRDHFKVAYQRHPEDPAGLVAALSEHVASEFDPVLVRYGASPKRGDPPEFSVRERTAPARTPSRHPTSSRDFPHPPTSTSSPMVPSSPRCRPGVRPTAPESSTVCLPNGQRTTRRRSHREPLGPGGRHRRTGPPARGRGQLVRRNPHPEVRLPVAGPVRYPLRLRFHPVQTRTILVLVSRRARLDA